MRIPRPSFKPAVFWLALTTILLCLPGSAIPSQNWFSDIWLDKWIHAGLFGVLTALWCFALLSLEFENRIRKLVFIATTILSIAYGTLMEFVQAGLIPNRSFDVWDIVSDAAGSLLGLVFASWYFRS